MTLFCLTHVPLRKGLRGEHLTFPNMHTMPGLIGYCIRNETSFPEPDLLLGKWLGVATKEGQVMTYWILTDKGKVIARSSVAHLPDLDRRDPERTAEQDQFMTKICQIKNYDPNIKGPIFQQSELDINDDIPD